MAGLMLLATLIGLWLIVSVLVNQDCFLGLIDVSHAELVLGDEAVRWIVGSLGAVFLFIGMWELLGAL